MASYVDLVYLVIAVLFILGLKRLSSPATARAGNRPLRALWARNWVEQLMGLPVGWTQLPTEWIG